MKFSLSPFGRRKPVRKSIRRTILKLEELEDCRLFSTHITQYHVDAQSTGANLTETQLTPSNVNAADFGQLYNTPLDGQVPAAAVVRCAERIGRFFGYIERRLGKLLQRGQHFGAMCLRRHQQDSQSSPFALTLSQYRHWTLPQ